MENKLTADQRRAEFEKVFNSMPGKPVERIREICRVLHCKEVTVRIWRVKSEASSRAIPEAKLRILQDAIAGEPSQAQ